MKFFCLLLLMLVASGASRTESPIKETIAYSRETIPGIPGAAGGPGTDNNPFPPTYLIYLVVKKGTPISQAKVCVRGKSYSATLRKVESPVVVEHDAGVPTEKKDTLVEKTSDDVFQVEMDRSKALECNEPEEAELARHNEVVVSLESGHTKWHGAAKKIAPLKARSAS